MLILTEERSEEKFLSVVKKLKLKDNGQLTIEEVYKQALFEFFSVENEENYCSYDKFQKLWENLENPINHKLARVNGICANISKLKDQDTIRKKIFNKVSLLPEDVSFKTLNKWRGLHGSAADAVLLHALPERDLVEIESLINESILTEKL